MLSRASANWSLSWEECNAQNGYGLFWGRGHWLRDHDCFRFNLYEKLLEFVRISYKISFAPRTGTSRISLFLQIHGSCACLALSHESKLRSFFDQYAPTVHSDHLFVLRCDTCVWSVGQRFAMMSMKSTLARLLRKYRFLPGSNDPKLDVDVQIVLVSKSGVPLVVQHRD